MEEFMTSMRGYDKIPAVERAIKNWEKMAATERNSKRREDFTQHATNIKNQKVTFLRKVQTISNNIKNDPKIDKDTKEQFFIDLYKLKRNNNQELSKNAFENLLDDYSKDFDTKKYAKANKEHKVAEGLKNGFLNTVAGKNNIALTGITKGILTTAAISAFSYMKFGKTTVEAIKVIPWIIKNAWKINPALGIAASALLVVGASVLIHKVFKKEANAALKNRETKKEFVNNLEMPENEDDFDKELEKVYNNKEKENKESLKAKKAKKITELKAKILSAPALKDNRTDYKPDAFFDEVKGNSSSYSKLCEEFAKEKILSEDEIKKILIDTINELNENNKKAKIDKLDKALKGTNETDKATYEKIYKDAENNGLSKEDIEKVFANNRATLPENWSKELVGDEEVKNAIAGNNDYKTFVESYKTAVKELFNENSQVTKLTINANLKKFENVCKNTSDSKTKELFESMTAVYKTLAEKTAKELNQQNAKKELEAKGLDATTLDNLIK